jgi:RNA polymerase sigma-70 factor (ECF subfamily)
MPSKRQPKPRNPHSSPRRPASASGQPQPKSTPNPDEIPDDDAPDIDDSAQLPHEDGVVDDMASAALNPALEAALESGTIPGLQTDYATLTAPAEWAKLTDAEIMLRVSAGDEAGYDLLIAKYRRPIVHFMFRMVHNQAVAEELAQEVFLRVYRSRQTYRAEARFSTWLYRIATNLGVNHARDHKLERTASTLYLDEPDSETGSTPDISDGALTVEQQMIRRERMDAIRQHVMALPERQRNAVLMHKYQEMDYKQIGDVLKLSESATKSLLFRAYQTLRDRLKDFL